MVEPIFWRNTTVRARDGKHVPVPGKRPTLVMRKAADVAALDAGADLALDDLDLGADMALDPLLLAVPPNQDIQDYVNALKDAVEAHVNAQQATLVAYVNDMKAALETDSASRRDSLRDAGLMR